jgi:hypothetical protein
MACAVESVVSKLPQTPGKEFRRKIGSTSEKSKSSRPNMTKKELKAVKYFRLKNVLGFFRQTVTTAQWCWMNPNTRIS